MIQSDRVIVQIASSSSDKQYEVHLFNDGRVYCPCPAWKFQRLNPAVRVCKHTKQASSKIGQHVANAVSA